MRRDQSRSRRSNRLRHAIGRLLAAVTAASAACAAQPQDMTLSLSPVKTRPLTNYRGHEDETLREQTATFDLGDARYAITYKAGYKETAPDRAFPLEGYIGMPGPTACNWYHSGFLRVLIDGHDIGDTALSSMTVLQEDDRGYTDMVWHHDLADVRVRFIGIAGRTALYCTITVEPAEPLQSLVVRTRCYPSFFTSHHNRTGARRIRTPATLIEEGQNTGIDAADNWWLCYYDDVFDVAKGEGSGPCAMMVLPEQARTISCRPGGYAVDTAVECAPDSGTVRLAFWDFKGRPNEDVLTDMHHLAESARSELSKLDPTPRTVQNAKLKTHREELAAILESDVCRQTLGKDKVAAIRQWLHATETAAPHSDRLSVDAQEQILRGIDDMQDILWEARLARLLAEF